MKTKTAGKIVLGFASMNSAISLFRLYKYFFTGHDITPLTGDTALYLTVTMIFISLIAYIVGGFMVAE